MKTLFLNTLHPSCLFFFFVSVIGFTVSCVHPVMVLLSLCCALLLLGQLKGWRSAAKTLRFSLLLFLLIAIANPLFNHRGVTLLFMLFNQWITLEAVMYGMVSGCQLVSVVLWFACYQIVMTSDKFLYLFGKAAPAASLLITMTLRLLPLFRSQLTQIQQSQQMQCKKPDRLFLKIHTVIRHLSTLLSWSMENAVEMADSMKSRGFGQRRRTTFHLFRYDSRDVRVQGCLLLFAGVCLLGRCFGHGTMEFYPRMDAVITGGSGMMTYLSFALLAVTPTLLEMKEAVLWRSYGLIH